MSDAPILRRLADETAPTVDAKGRIHASIQKRIRTQELSALVQQVHPSPSFASLVKERMLRILKSRPAAAIESLSSSLLPDASAFARMKDAVMARLSPLGERPIFLGGFKWTAAFVLFLLVLRSMPLLLLAPSISAESGIQLIPTGSVSMYVGGVWQSVTQPEVLRGPTMIRTDDDGRATIVMSDDGVFRLAPDTTLKIHIISDLSASGGPAATLVRGSVWALGLIPPFADGLSLETPGGTVSVNAGSLNIQAGENRSTVTVYDRGATVQSGKQTVLLVTGEQVTTRETGSLSIYSLPTSSFGNPWVSGNLSQDAVHRAEIARLQEERRKEMAGILPTSFLYSAKRLAEEVDVFFTLTEDGRSEKRVQQADTRLAEALALLQDGEKEAADAPLQEYRDSLLALAVSKDDNLVQSLLRKQIADASTSIAVQGTGSLAILQRAVSEVSAAIPNANLKPKDIEGYVLVDRLARLNQVLSQRPASAAADYVEIRPYLQGLLSADAGMHPLLKKEATSLLVTTSTLVKEANAAAPDRVLMAIGLDIAQYLPTEQESVRVSEEELASRVEKMIERIFVFRHPRSRYNQLLAEMQTIESDPNRGTLLRRLKAALPEGLGEYVNTEIQKLGNELKD